MKIMLVCSAGMSTSILVQKMRDAAAAQGIDATIDAVGESSLKEHIDSLDVVLVGPQVRYLEPKIKKQLGDSIPVAVIDNIAYGMMKGDQVLEQALALAKQ